MTEYYSVDFKCKNCKRMNWLNKIPQGTELNDFLEEDNTRCRACGCLLFVAKKPKETKKDAEVQDDD